MKKTIFLGLLFASIQHLKAQSPGDSSGKAGIFQLHLFPPATKPAPLGAAGKKQFPGISDYRLNIEGTSFQIPLTEAPINNQYPEKMPVWIPNLKEVAPMPNQQSLVVAGSWFVPTKKRP